MATAKGAASKAINGVAAVGQSVQQQQNAVAGGIVNDSFTMPDNPINKLRLPHIGGQSKTGADRGGGSLQAAMAAREGGRQAQPQAGDRTNEARKAVIAVGGGANIPYPRPSPPPAQGQSQQNEQRNRDTHQR